MNEVLSLQGVQALLVERVFLQPALELLKLNVHHFSVRKQEHTGTFC